MTKTDQFIIKIENKAHYKSAEQDNFSEIRKSYRSFNPGVEIWLDFTGDNDLKSLPAMWNSIKKVTPNAIHQGVLINACSRRPNDFKNWNINTIDVDNGLSATVKYFSEHPCNDMCPQQNKKFLFLTGKPLSSNRLPVLDMIDRSILRDGMVTSLFWKESSYELAEKLYGIGRKRCDELLNRYKGSPDGIDTKIRIDNGPGANSFHCDGLRFFDIDLYRKTSVSLIPETEIDRDYGKANLSEKTFRTILNLHPFLLLAPPGSVDYLKKSIGINCFQDFIPYPDYNEKIGRYDELVKNWYMIEDNLFALMHHKNWTQIHDLCRMNKKLLIDKGRNQEQLINDILPNQNWIETDYKYYLSLM